MFPILKWEKYNAFVVIVFIILCDNINKYTSHIIAKEEVQTVLKKERQKQRQREREREKNMEKEKARESERERERKEGSLDESEEILTTNPHRTHCP